MASGSSRNVAMSLNFFTSSLQQSDQDAFAQLVEEYFTINEEEPEGN